jgi:hypothetical protein
MEDSTKGIFLSFAIIFLFIFALINFITIFPGEQGYSYETIENKTYLTISNISVSNYTDISNSMDTGFEEWDIEVGFMGSNTQKASKSSISSFVTNVFDVLKIISNEVFSTSDGGTHPIIWVMGVFISITSIILVFLFIKFIRTGT